MFSDILIRRKIMIQIVQFCDGPTKITAKSSRPKIFNFLTTQENTEFQNFEPHNIGQTGKYTVLAMKDKDHDQHVRKLSHILIDIIK